MASLLTSGGMGRNVSFFVRVHQTNMTYQQLLTIWKAADRLGYDGASLYDLLAVPCLESWTVLTALKRYASEEGREPAAVGLTHNATVILSRDPQAIRTRVEYYANSRGYSVANAWQRLEHALVGTPEQCVARLQAYVALGIRHFFLLFPDLPDVTSLELFARTVLPVFRSA